MSDCGFDLSKPMDLHTQGSYLRGFIDGRNCRVSFAEDYSGDAREAYAVGYIDGQSAGIAAELRAAARGEIRFTPPSQIGRVM